MLMSELLYNYLPIFIFLVIAIFISSLMLIIPFVTAPNKPDAEKLSVYECGFSPFGDARSKFDIKFYLVAILFLIFDLEIAFLFPWAITLGKLGTLGFVSMMVFLLIITIGFIYEWAKGALEWQ